MIEKAVEFIKNCKGKTVIVYDTDGDGIGAAVIVARILKRLFNKFPIAIPSSHDENFITEKIYKEILKQKPKFIITLDMPVDQELDFVLKLAKKSKILVIDHHQIHNDLNRFENIIHVNPIFLKIKILPYKYCVSKIVYDLCSKIIDINDLDWLAGIGIINDYCGDEWKDFLDEIYEKYPELKGKELYSFDSKLGYICHLVSSGYYFGKKYRGLGYKVCLEASSPVELIKAETPSSKQLKRLYEKVENEIKTTMKNWKNDAEIIENKKLILLKLKTKMLIQSPISTKISLEKPDYTIVVINTSGKKAYISLRRRDGKVDCGKLASKVVNGLKNSSGGGHSPAAGANILKKDLEEFKDRIFSSF
jgi:single-stranded DNA-specific DHH superfamily exonuclease